MAIESIVTAGIGLASKVADFLNTKQSRKYIDQMVKIKKSILEEESRGYFSDDTKLERLYDELKIIFEAIELELANSGLQPKTNITITQPADKTDPQT